MLRGDLLRSTRSMCHDASRVPSYDLLIKQAAKKRPVSESIFRYPSRILLR